MKTSPEKVMAAEAEAPVEITKELKKFTKRKQPRQGCFRLN